MLYVLCDIAYGDHEGSAMLHGHVACASARQHASGTRAGTHPTPQQYQRLKSVSGQQALDGASDEKRATEQLSGHSFHSHRSMQRPSFAAPVRDVAFA